MRNSILIVVLFCLCPISAFAQHEADNWFFGYQAGISFKNGMVTELIGGQTNTREGTAVISDKTTGELLFYTDGVTVWNRYHRIMSNGTGLKGGTSCTQSALIVPYPENPLHYYVFTAPDLTPGTGNSALYCSLVSLETSEGRVQNKNTILIDSISEKLTGTIDCSGTGFWILAHHRRRSEFYAFHVTASGVVSRPVVSTYNGEISDYTLGYMKISPNRTKLALVSGTEGGHLSLFDFNAETGKVANCTTIYNNIGRNVYTYGLAFSPDNTKLYTTLRRGVNSKLDAVQYEINLQDSIAIRKSVTTVYASAYNVAWQLGPDGKLYISGYEDTGKPFLDVVNYPNRKGAACDYRHQAIKLSNNVDSGLPNFMDYYFNQVYIQRDSIVICPNNSVQIGDAPLADYTYSWTPADGLDNPNISNPIASPVQTTEYTLKTTINGSCENSHVYVVKVNTVKANVNSIPLLCSPSSVRLSASGGDSYEWSPTYGLDNPKKAAPIASPSISTRYKVVVTRGFCKDSAYVDVNLFKAIASGDTEICQGLSVPLSAKGGDTYLWYPITGLDNPNSAAPIASPTETTKYRVLISRDNCIDSAFVIVMVHPFSGATAGADKTVCLGASSELGVPPDTNNTYSWQPPVNLDDATKSNPTVTPSGNGTTEYILTVTSKNGCIARDTVLVTAGSITAKASSDTAMCSGSSVQLLASGGSDYDWSPITGLDNPNIPNPIASPNITTTYKVRVSSGSKCEDFDSVTVTVNPIPIANAGTDQTSCKGETTQLGALPQDGYTYQWQPEAGLNDPTKSNPNATPTVTTEYTLTVTNSGGCTSKDTVLITVGNIEAIVSGDTSVCAGTGVQLSASGGSTYKWSPIDGLDNPNSANPIASPISTTEYTVVVSSGFCIDSTTVRVTITPPPVADAGADKTPCKGDTTQLGASPQDGYTYNWQPATGLDSPNKSNPQLIANESTEYILTVTNPMGCTSQDTVLVTVKPPSEHSFTLSASTPAIIPGQSFQVSLQIPGGVSSWNARLVYDNLVMKFASVAQTSTGITFDIPKEEKGELLLKNGRGGNGDIVLNYDVYLPYNSDTIFPIKLSVDDAVTLPCEGISTRGTTVELGIFCGRRIRTVSSTGKNYFLINKENGVNFGVGLSGRVKLELYDYTGTLREILTDGMMEAGEYSLGFDLPTGVYFCRINAGMYNDVQKVIVVQ